MQKPSERHKLTSDNNIIKFKKPVHDPFKANCVVSGIYQALSKMSQTISSPSFGCYLDSAITSPK